MRTLRSKPSMLKAHCAAILLTTLAMASTAHAADHTVQMLENPMRFKDRSIPVTVGDRVTWENPPNNETHTATARNSDGQVLFDTRDVDENEDQTIDFDDRLYRAAGGSGGEVTIRYRCKYHTSMQGEIKLSPVKLVSKKLRVRRSYGSLDPSEPGDRRILEGLERGIEVLRRRSAIDSTDPTGWLGQARLHADSCPHANWWFLPWHRMYVLHFERILQDAIGDPDFALPYWDWTDRPQATLPADFRDSTSSLWDRNRRVRVNDGSSYLDWSGYPGGDIFRYSINLSGFSNFGSYPTRSPRDTGRKGAFEAGPHDTVHSWVSGPRTPDMGNPPTAARDPIFWMHHANIDRIWARWLVEASHQNPSDRRWLEQSFTFVDPDGSSTQMTVADALDTSDPRLGYVYDDAIPTKSKPNGKEGGYGLELVASVNVERELDEELEETLKLPERLQEKEKDDEATEASIVVDGMTFTAGAPAAVEVQVSVDGEEESIGAFSFFDGPHHGEATGEHRPGGGQSLALPLSSDWVERALADPDADEITVTLRRRELDRREPGPRAVITVGRISLAFASEAMPTGDLGEPVPSEEARRLCRTLYGGEDNESRTEENVEEKGEYRSRQQRRGRKRGDGPTFFYAGAPRPDQSLRGDVNAVNFWASTFHLTGDAGLVREVVQGRSAPAVHLSAPMTYEGERTVGSDEFEVKGWVYRAILGDVDVLFFFANEEHKLNPSRYLVLWSTDGEQWTFHSWCVRGAADPVHQKEEAAHAK
jgi:plastocyanin